MDTRNRIKEWIQKSIKTKQSIHDDPILRKQIETAAAILMRAAGRQTIFACGNGGSEASHLVAELLNRFTRKREYPLPAVDLSVSVSTLTAISNDYSFDEVFSKPLTALMKPGDVLVGISTSGESENVLNALKVATDMNNISVFLTGAGVDVYREHGIRGVQHINVPSTETPIIQESHLMIIHILCLLIDDYLEGR